MLSLVAPVGCAGCGARSRRRLCDDCRPPAIHRAPSPTELVRGTWTLGGYDGPLGAAVRKAKYGRDRALTRALGRALARRLGPAVPADAFTAVVPAPSPWTRRLARGFSPASVLAAEVARELRLPLRHALSLSPGPKQASMGATARRRALTGRLRSRLPVHGRILLVDDVATTGATAEACSRELLGDGAREVWLATICVTR